MARRREQFYDDRIWPIASSRSDYRTCYQQDRDRILYSSAFRRLGGVTQVVSPSEGHVFHNRLTHSLEVAQIARRLAERLSADKRLSNWHSTIDADVVEAAALAHDLGHPPFGHVAEKELDRLVRDVGKINDGYEGNAQSLRILTKLSVRWDYDDLVEKEGLEPKVPHDRGEYGLNLTRATLNGVLKYPCLWQPHGKASRKWGVYLTEEKEFEWIRMTEGGGSHQTIEAAIMDWADDIAYSIQDTEDFYRAGLIPLERLQSSSDEQAEFLEAVFNSWSHSRYVGEDERDRMRAALGRVCEYITVEEPYQGTPSQRVCLREFTSLWIDYYIKSTRLTKDQDRPIQVPDDVLDEVEISKQFVWQYVILNPRLATLQAGHRAIIAKLFDEFMNASELGPTSWQIFPPRFRKRLLDWNKVFGYGVPRQLIVRNVSDAISSMTDVEAQFTFQRISGISSGSLMDRLST